MYGESFVTSREWVAFRKAEEEREYWAEQETIDRAEADSPETVDGCDACPNCGEAQVDYLVWAENGEIQCQCCGTVYRPAWLRQPES